MLHIGRSAEQASTDSCGSLEMVTHALKFHYWGGTTLTPQGDWIWGKGFSLKGWLARAGREYGCWPLTAGMSCSAETRTGFSMARVGIATACGSAMFQPQLQGLLTSHRKNSSADEQDLELLQASLRFSFIPYQDELKLQIYKLLRKLQSSIKTSNFDWSWSQRYSLEMASLCISCYFPGTLKVKAEISDTSPPWLAPYMKFQYNLQVRREDMETETCRDERIWGR